MFCGLTIALRALVCPTESNLACDGALSDHIDLRAVAKLFILLRSDTPA